MVNQLFGTMATIRRLATQIDAILGDIVLEELPPGERDAINRSIATSQIILEVIDDYEQKIPSKGRSVTKSQNILGEPSV